MVCPPSGGYDRKGGHMDYVVVRRFPYLLGALAVSLAVRLAVGLAAVGLVCLLLVSLA